MSWRMNSVDQREGQDVAGGEIYEFVTALSIRMRGQAQTFAEILDVSPSPSR